MKIRKAKVADVQSIYELINYYAELDRMLFRSIPDIYENLQIFNVAEDEGEIIGCAALQVIWSDLGEIKSLAVSAEHKNKGIGRELVNYTILQARELGLQRVFALTLEPEFFLKTGFDVIDKSNLPMKVWSDCAKCSKQAHCDETAMLKVI
ncbi:MAG TPA: N-acetyltransferase [Sedimentisphaerales bacterium]|nr:N-acetyltransferase [Sedimentisphaerales bacterium]